VCHHAHSQKYKISYYKFITIPTNQVQNNLKYGGKAKFEVLYDKLTVQISAAVRHHVYSQQYKILYYKLMTIPTNQVQNNLKYGGKAKFEVLYDKLNVQITALD